MICWVFFLAGAFVGLCLGAIFFYTCLDYAYRDIPHLRQELRERLDELDAEDEARK